MVRNTSCSYIDDIFSPCPICRWSCIRRANIFMNSNSPRMPLFLPPFKAAVRFALFWWNKLNKKKIDEPEIKKKIRNITHFKIFNHFHTCISIHIHVYLSFCSLFRIFKSSFPSNPRHRSGIRHRKVAKNMHVFFMMNRIF